MESPYTCQSGLRLSPTDIEHSSCPSFQQVSKSLRDRANSGACYRTLETERPPPARCAQSRHHCRRIPLRLEPPAGPREPLEPQPARPSYTLPHARQHRRPLVGTRCSASWLLPCPVQQASCYFSILRDPCPDVCSAHVQLFAKCCGHPHAQQHENRPFGTRC